jgi:hypothetical protein
MKRHRPPNFRASIGGQEWNIRFVRKTHSALQGNLGICYWDTREIYVRYDMAKSTIRMVLIHELLHATCPMLYCAEEWVDQTASEIAASLQRSGL